MGDEGQLYVSDAIVNGFTQHLLPRASVVLPNAFEAGLLTGVEVDGETGAKEAIRKLHEAGPHTVVRWWW